MPAKSKAQQRYMGMMYSNPKMRKEAGISKDVAKKFAGTKHDGLPEKVQSEAMNYTEWLEHLDQAVPPLYQVEGKLPQCPPGYVWSRKRKDCIPKTEKDKVSGRLNDRDNTNGASYNVWGRTGLNGDGYAYEEPFVNSGGGFNGEE